MKPLNSTLIRKLALVLVIKLAALFLLWWGFVRVAHVRVDGDSVAAQFLHIPIIPAKGVSP
jgi:hypothetical protein